MDACHKIKMSEEEIVSENKISNEEDSNQNKQNFSVELEEEEETKENTTEMKLSDDENQQIDEEEEVKENGDENTNQSDEIHEIENDTLDVIADNSDNDLIKTVKPVEKLSSQSNSENTPKDANEEEEIPITKKSNAKPIQENEIENEIENLSELSDSEIPKQQPAKTQKRQTRKSELEFNKTSKLNKEKFKPQLKGPKQLTINSQNEKLVKFPNVKDDGKSIVRVLNLTHNRLVNFENMNQLPHLTSLILDENYIRSFKGACYCKSLQWVSMLKCLISKNGNFKLMTLIAFDNIQEKVDNKGAKHYVGSIISINNSPVTEKLRHNAFKLAPTLRPLLIEGKVISSLNPLRVVNNETDNEDDKIVEPNEELLEATTRLTTLIPSVAEKILTRSKLQSQIREQPRPSIAVICNEVVASEDMSVFVPDAIVRDVAAQLSELRKQYERTEQPNEEEEEKPDNEQSNQHDSVIDNDKNNADTENEEYDEIINEEESGEPSEPKKSDV